MITAKKQVLIIFMILCLLVFAAACSDNAVPETPKEPDQSDNMPGKEEEAMESETEDQEELLKEIMKLAREGKVPGCPFIAGETVFDEVEEKWGTADRSDYIAEAKGTYAVYEDRGFVFGINKGCQVFEVRSMGEELKKIKISQVKRVLGSPDKVLQYPGQDIFGFETGTDYKLEFVFPKAKNEQDDPSLDHLNVLYPPGTVNMMADDPGRQW